VSAYLTLTLSAVFFGGTWVAGEVAVAGLPPMTIASGRFIIASVLLYGWARLQGHGSRRISARDIPLILTLGASAIAIYNALFLYGLRLAPASDGAIIVPGFAPVFTALLAWPILRERVGAWTVAGFSAALIGLYFVIGPSGGEQSAHRLLGDIFFLLGALCWGIYAVAGKTATSRFTPVTSTLYATVAGTLMLIPFGLAERGWKALAAAPAVSWAGLLYLATFGTVLAFVFFYEGVKRIGAGPASAFAFLVPVVGVLSSALLLGEPLTAGIVMGGALVLAGLWLVQRGSHAAAAGRTAAASRP
jgi:drug/metabolite transporter (DMT)-like permease